MWSLEAHRPRLWIWICLRQLSWVDDNLGINGGWVAKKCGFCWLGDPSTNAKGPTKAGMGGYPDTSPNHGNGRTGTSWNGEQGAKNYSVDAKEKEEGVKNNTQKYTHPSPPGVTKRGPKEPKWAPEPRQEQAIDDFMIFHVYIRVWLKT